MKVKQQVQTKFTAKYLDKLIEEATMDAYNDSEQASGFFAMIEEHLSLPSVTEEVLGQVVTVAKIDLTARDQIVAVCKRREAIQRIPILDLTLPAPPPKGAEWIEAYRRWCRNW